MSEKFLELGLREDLANALEAIGVTEPTPIQQSAIPKALEGRNVIGQSATGTGKTFAYLLPLLQAVDAAKPGAQAVVLAPTFELAMQIYRQLELIVRAGALKVTCASIIGGANIARQIEKLKKKPQIIVGSAGRIIELKKKGKLKLDQVRVVVLDEADRLLDDQHLDAVKLVAESAHAKRQYLLFSATITPGALQRAEFVKDPVLARLKEESIARPNIENLYFVADFRDKIEALRKITGLLNVRRGLVFVNRTYDLRTALDKLRYHDVKVTALTGEGSKQDRKSAIDAFTKGKARLMLATDLAARGLDIADVDYVIHLDLPENEKIYLHRAGRTGRAGKSGVAITLAAPKEVGRLQEIARKLKLTLSEKRLSGGEIRDGGRPNPAARRNPARKEGADRQKRQGRKK